MTIKQLRMLALAGIFLILAVIAFISAQVEMTTMMSVTTLEEYKNDRTHLLFGATGVCFFLSIVFFSWWFSHRQQG